MTLPSDAQARQWLRFLCRRFDAVHVEPNIQIERVLDRAREMVAGGADEAVALLIAGSQAGRLLGRMWKPVTYGLVAANLNERGLKLLADSNEMRRVILMICTRGMSQADLENWFLENTARRDPG